jgi:hypothetical protein
MTDAEKAKRWRDNHPGSQAAAKTRWRMKDLPRARELGAAASRRSRARLRAEVHAAYENRCACCGESHREFLEMDHEGGGGNEHRRQIGGSGVALYTWLKRRGFPRQGFRLLCSNCNKALSIFGTCPHQRDAEVMA